MPEDQKQPTDLSPNGLNVYGYCIIYRKDQKWSVDQCDEYQNLPAHYPFLDEAMDRVHYLRERGVDCRVGALLAEATDTADEFERNKTDDSDTH
jgi:hypothetical protein